MPLSIWQARDLYDPAPLIMKGGEDRARMLLAMGESQAHAQNARAALWANAIANVGHDIGQYVSEAPVRQALAQERQQRGILFGVQAEQRQQEMAAQKQAAIESDGLRQMFADPNKQPTLKDVSGLVGPERAIKIFQGLEALQPKQKEQTPDEKMTTLGKMLSGMDALPEDIRAEMFPHVRQSALQQGLVGPQDVPEAYNRNWWMMARNYGQKPEQAPKAGEEAYIFNRFGANPSADQRLQGHKEYSEAGRKPEDNEVPSLTPEGLGVAAKMYAQTGQLPPMGMGKAGASLRAQIINEAAKGSPDIAANKAAYGADTGSLKKLQQQADAVTAFENTAKQNSALLEGIMKDLPDTGTKFLNRPYRALQSELGSEKMAQFDAIRQSVQNEYARIISNPNLSGVMSDSARKEAETFLSPSATVGQIRSALKVLQSEAHNRRSNFESQLESIRGRITGKPAEKDNDPMGIR